MGLAAVLATGCAGSGEDRQSDADAGTAPSAADEGAPQAEAGSGAAAEAPAAEAGDGARSDRGTGPVIDLVATERAVVRTGSMRVTVDDPAEAAEDVRVRVTDAGGFVADERVRAGSGTVDITVRVPAEEFERVRSAVGELGEVTEQDVQAEDVTAELVDLESRIASQRASVERVQELLGQAGDVDQLALVEGELASREAELESLLGQERVLAEQVALSTLSVHLSEDAAPEPTAEAAGFTDGFRRGWATLTDGGRAALAATGFALPFAVPALVVVAAGWTWRRRVVAPTAAPTAEPRP
jgi:hypothetical protein